MSKIMLTRYDFTDRRLEEIQFSSLIEKREPLPNIHEERLKRFEETTDTMRYKLRDKDFLDYCKRELEKGEHEVSVIFDLERALTELSGYNLLCVTCSNDGAYVGKSLVNRDYSQVKIDQVDVLLQIQKTFSEIKVIGMYDFGMPIKIARENGLTAYDSCNIVMDNGILNEFNRVLKLE